VNVPFTSSPDGGIDTTALPRRVKTIRRREEVELRGVGLPAFSPSRRA
jgi:hypothetical protein